MRIALTIDGGRMRRVLERVRTITGRTGCGLCGIETLAALPRARLVGPSIGTVPATAIRRALRALAEQQTLFRQTGAVHGVHGVFHIGDQRVQFRRIEAIDLPCPLPESGVAHLKYGLDCHNPPDFL